jgi:hypothetical protein
MYRASAITARAPIDQRNLGTGADRGFLRRDLLAFLIRRVIATSNGNRAAVRRLLHRLPQPKQIEHPAAGSDYAARVRLGAGLRGSTQLP